MALQTTSGLPALETACIPECKISFFASTEIYSNLHRQSNDGAESTQTKKQFLNEMANLFEKKTLRNFSWRSGSFHPLGKTTLCLCWKIVLIKSDLGEGATRTCLAQPVWWQSLQREVIFTAPGTHSQYLHITHQTMKFLPNSNKKKNKPESAVGLFVALVAQVLGETKARPCADLREGDGGVWPSPCPTYCHQRGQQNSMEGNGVSGPRVAVRQPCPHLSLPSGGGQGQDGAGCVCSTARASPSWWPGQDFRTDGQGNISILMAKETSPSWWQPKMAGA